MTVKEDGKMIKRYRFPALAVMVLCMALLFCACGSKSGGVETDQSEEGKISQTINSVFVKKVEFQCGSLPADSESIQLTVEAGEVSRLDEFTNLKRVDFLDSACTKEIFDWTQANPQVETLYQVSFPNGAVVSCNAEVLDLSGLCDGDVAETIEKMAYLPELKMVLLGRPEAEKRLSIEALQKVTAAGEGIACDMSEYSMPLMGQEIPFTVESMDLKGISAEELDAFRPVFAYLKALTYIDLGDAELSPELSWETIGALQEELPETVIDYRFSVYGKTFSTADETIDINHIQVGDNGDAIRALLPYLHHCTYLDMDSCGVSNERMADLRDAFPDVKVVWRVNWANYSVRTDVEKILASKPSVGGNVSNQDLEVLKYCTDLRFLDIGHNDEISDIGFCAYMPNLEVVIIGMNKIYDISPLTNCMHLEYLEVFNCNLTNIEPLAGHYELKHLNICMTEVSDITPVMDIELDRFFIGGNNHVPRAQIDEYLSLHPDSIVNTEVSDPGGANWRYVGGTWPLTLYPRYELLCEQFGYVVGGESDYCFYWNDPRY